MVPNSGGGAMIAFKRSVVEGVRVEPEQADRVVRIINQLMLRRQPGRALAAA